MSITDNSRYGLADMGAASKVEEERRIAKIAQEDESRSSEGPETGVRIG